MKNIKRNGVALGLGALALGAIIGLAHPASADSRHAQKVRKEEHHLVQERQQIHRADQRHHAIEVTALRRREQLQAAQHRRESERLIQQRRALQQAAARRHAVRVAAQRRENLRQAQWNRTKELRERQARERARQRNNRHDEYKSHHHH